jgi:hypothetical protein
VSINVPTAAVPQLCTFHLPISLSADAVGMGLNLSIRRIVFTSLRKFDGTQERLLTTAEIKQVGWAVCPRLGLGLANRAGWLTGWVAGLDAALFIGWLHLLVAC